MAVKPLPAFSRCELHQTLVLDGRACTLCYDEQHPKDGAPLRPGELGSMRGERIEVEGIVAPITPREELAASGTIPLDES